MTGARRQLPALLDKARSGEWQLIGRRGRSEVVLANVADLDELLCTVYRFHPQIDFAEQGVGIWLPELETHGAGDVTGVLAMLERDADAASEAGGAASP